MKQLSVEQAFQWAQAVATREWRLILPVALAFFALPGLVVDVFMPEAAKAILPTARLDPAVQGQAMLALLAVGVVNMAGWLTINALALVPGISVAEAIGRGVRRLPSLLGAVLLVTAGLVAALVVVALLVGSIRADLGAMQRVLGSIILVAGAVLYIRLAFLSPWLVERGGGPVQALVRSWRLTGGAAWRIAGAIVVYVVGGMVVVVALSSALGAVITLVARAAGAGGVAPVLGAIIFRVVVALVSTGFQLLIAGLYRQVATRDA